MLIFSFCIAGSNCEPYEYLFHFLAKKQNGEATVLDFDSADEIGRYLTASVKQNVIITSRAPSASLVELSQKADGSSVFFWRDPRNCVIELMQQHAIPFEQALRSVAFSCAALAPLVLLPRVIKVRLDDDRTIENARLVDVARRLGLPLQDGEIPDILEQANGIIELGSSDAKRLRPSRGPADLLHGMGKTMLDERARVIVEKCLGGYATLFERGRIGPISWPPHIFLLADNQTAPTRIIDITGPRRGLTFGPYLYLPRGRWAGRVPIAVAQDALEESFIVIVVINEMDIVDEAVIEPEAPGIYSVSLEFQIDDPGSRVEFRILNVRSCFEGHIALGDVALVPV